MRKAMIFLPLVLTACLIGCTKRSERTLQAAAQEGHKVAPEQASTDMHSTDAVKRQRPIFQWAGMVAVGDNIDRVNAGAKAIYFPPLDCSYSTNPKGLRTCNSGDDSGLVTANFDKGTGRLVSLHDRGKDPERTNFRALQSTLNVYLGRPIIDTSDGAKFTWHQNDQSMVTLQWSDGTYNLSFLQNEDAP